MLEQPNNAIFLEPYNFAEKLEFLKHWGRSTHSFSTLYSDAQHFRVSGVDGYIPIVISKKLILVSAEPVCNAYAFPVLILALKDYAQAQDCSLAALPVSEWAREAFKSAGFETIYIGKEPIFELKDLPKISKSIRQAVERARRKGLKVIPYDENYRMQIELLCRKWQGKSELPPMEFLFQLRPLDLRVHKKYFLLVDRDNYVKAFLACSPIYARNGWYLEDLIRDHLAPNGSTELLVTETLKSLAQQGYDMASLALAPLAGLPDKDESHPLLNRILRLCYKHLSFIYHFQTLEYFKTKFLPSRWEKNYICYCSTEPMLALAANLLRSLLPQDIPAIVKHKIEKWLFS